MAVVLGSALPELVSVEPGGGLPDTSQVEHLPRNMCLEAGYARCTSCNATDLVTSLRFKCGRCSDCSGLVEQGLAPPESASTEDPREPALLGASSSSHSSAPVPSGAAFCVSPLSARVRPAQPGGDGGHPVNRPCDAQCRVHSQAFSCRARCSLPAGHSQIHRFGCDPETCATFACKFCFAPRSSHEEKAGMEPASGGLEHASSGASSSSWSDGPNVSIAIFQQVKLDMLDILGCP